MLKSFKLWILASRPNTLSASIVPVLVGTALVKMEKGVEFLSFSVLFFSVFSSCFIQIGTNLINDALDFRQGKDTKKRLGPLRVSLTGQLDDQFVFKAGLFCFFLAFLLGLPLVFIGGWVIFWIGIFALLFGYLYTGGPFPLAYRGLGEVFVILFFGLVAVGGVYYLHTGTLSLRAFLTGLQMGCLCTVLLVINNMRDVEEDKSTNKKTLAVRWGLRFSRFEILCLLIFSFSLNFIWILKIKTLLFFLTFLSAPLAFFLVFQIFRTPPSKKYNTYLLWSSILYALFGCLLSVSFIFS